MSTAQLVALRSAPKVIEGTPEEILRELKTLSNGHKLTLIIPGDEINSDMIAEQCAVGPIDSVSTVEQIFGPSLEGFTQSGLTDEELGDFLDSEVHAYRAEQLDNGSNKD